MFNRDQRKFDPTAPCVYRVFPLDDHLPIYVLADTEAQLRDAIGDTGACHKPELCPTLAPKIDHVLPGDEGALRRELMTGAGFHAAPAF